MGANNKDVSAMADMLTALKSPEMRRILLRILRQSNLLLPSYAKGDALATAFNEGLRAMGIYLKSEIDKADPDAFARLLNERRDIV